MAPQVDCSRRRLQNKLLEIIRWKFFKSQVECTNGICGRSEYVLINPQTDQVTNLVVRETASPNTEYVVPVELVSATIADTIQLHCSKAELEKWASSSKPRMSREDAHDESGYGGGLGTYYYMPFVTAEMTVQCPRSNCKFRQGNWG